MALSYYLPPAPFSLSPPELAQTRPEKKNKTTKNQTKRKHQKQNKKTQPTKQKKKKKLACLAA